MKLPNDQIIHYEGSKDGMSIDITRTELVRCRDCRFYDDVYRQCKIIRRHFAPMSYCSKGKRKGEEHG